MYKIQLKCSKQFKMFVFNCVMHLSNYIRFYITQNLTAIPKKKK